MRVRFFNIKWDTTDDDHPEGQDVDLPTECVLEVDDDVDLEEKGADVLSDEYGWCVFGFTYKVPRSFHKTVIQVVVLSEESYDPDNLSDVAYDITEGDCSGKWNVVEKEEVDGPTMASLLTEQGSDPSFFQLDDKGNDLNE